MTPVTDLLARPMTADTGERESLKVYYRKQAHL